MILGEYGGGEETLYHIDDLPVQIDRIDDTFTPWRKTVENEAAVRDTLDIPKPSDLSETILATKSEPEPANIPIPTERDNVGQDPDDRAVLDLEGGRPPAYSGLKSTSGMATICASTRKP